MEKRNRNQYILFFICFLITLGCTDKKTPVKIGFAGHLTGETSTISINSRNGALLAVERINKKGGVNGRRMEMIVKDDGLDPYTVLKVDEELIRENVAAIVGHVHSDMCMVASPLMERAGLVMVSPNASSDMLTGVDDCLFRILPPSWGTSAATAAYAYKKGLRKILCAYDLHAASANYSRLKFAAFKKVFESMGGSITEKRFASDSPVSFPEMIREMVSSHPDGYFIIASAQNTALICQHLRKLDSKSVIMITPWAYHPEFLSNGGKAVENVVLFHSFQRDSKIRAYVDFQEEFFKRFKISPGMWEAYGYEAVMVIAQALSLNSDPLQLKETIIKKSVFKGLQGNIVFDKYGDNQRKPLCLTVRKGAFVGIEDDSRSQHNLSPTEEGK